MSSQIFISYTTDDRVVADDLCTALESAGLTCWIAPRNIEPGSNWTASIMQAIAECRVMVLIFSAKSNESVHVVREILHAVEKGRVVFPIRIEDIVPSGGLAYCLVGVQWFDAASKPLQQQISSLVAQMRGLLERPSEAALALRPSSYAQSGRQMQSDLSGDIRFECNRCGQRLVIAATGAGETVPCPKCEQVLTVPQPPSTPPVSSAFPAEKRRLSVSDAQLLVPEAVARIDSSLTAVIGPIAPLVVRKAMARTASLADLRSELLAAIPVARDQESFLRGCGNLLPEGGSEVPAQAKLPPVAAPVAPGAQASALVDPKTAADLKATFAIFVGPMAKVLVDRALARASNVPELHDILASELDLPKDRERFLQLAKSPLRKGA